MAKKSKFEIFEIIGWWLILCLLNYCLWLLFLLLLNLFTRLQGSILLKLLSLLFEPLVSLSSEFRTGFWFLCLSLGNVDQFDLRSLVGSGFAPKELGFDLLGDTGPSGIFEHILFDIFG